MSEHLRKWRIALDRGGTFTDVVGLDPSGNFHSLKLLSHSPLYKDASLEGIRRLLNLRSDQILPGDLIEEIRFGTTVATNALLEKKGGKVALFITKGFADLLDIGYQNRPDIFRLCVQKPSPLYTVVTEVEERIDSQGRIVKGIDEQQLLSEIRNLQKAEIDAVAVVLMHSWKNPCHELFCARVLKEEGFRHILLSHTASNLIKIVSRGQSALVNAYLSPVLERYLREMQKETGGIPLFFMQSNGMLSPPALFFGNNALLSGPAGGVRAIARIAEENGIRSVIGFDMGGTSTDVSRFDGDFERIYEKDLGGILLQTEMLNINTVAAGGGSILHFDGSRMTAGPESAGAYPGPACYGFGGPLTVTDANLLTGRLVPEFFPKTFGADRNASLDIAIVKEKFSHLTEEINTVLGSVFSLQEVAAGFLRIINEKTAMAIREISVSKGFDVREYALVCFGGAGGQHACSIASLLDIKTILIHPLSSVMSAYGIGLAQPARKSVRTLLLPFSAATLNSLGTCFKEMVQECTGDEHIEGMSGNSKIKKEIDLRPKGTETFLTVPYGAFGETIKIFEDRYKRLFGFSPADAELEIVNLRVEIQEPAEFFLPYREKNTLCSEAPDPVAWQDIWYGGRYIKAPVYLRNTIPPLSGIKGPACIVDSHSTIIIDPRYEAETKNTGIILIRRLTGAHHTAIPCSSKADPVLLEVFHHIFMGIATEMGITLKNTAYSVNMKERLDFSCAVFDAEGNLVANAPHIPVHLGSMADTVKAILRDNMRSIRPGDVYLSNNPYKGGSHLPDMTVVCPIFSEQGKVTFFTAARGHHADIGGITPGSMPPFSSHIDEEGVLIDNFLLVRNGIFNETEIKITLTETRYPARNIKERISDLKAQIASCQKGMLELRQVVSRYGLATVKVYMRYIQDDAEYAVKKALHSFLYDRNRFHSAFADYLDDGTPIKVTVSLDGGPHPPDTVTATIDFTGTGKQHVNDNLNAPFAVTRSAVIYVLRSLIKEDIPLNSGCLKPVKIIIPEGTVLNPEYPAPVASGNVETSQRIVDVLLGAFGIAAASQGTMNNLLFAVEGETPYYETIAGGSGALDGCPGASGVQVHMTNTKITDPEILEYRHPGVRLERFTLRKGSGGKGRYPGGEGVIREITFLKPATVSIVSERRMLQPYGIKGGGPGEKGLNLLKQSDGRIRAVKHRECIKADTGDSIIIVTPGGGGYGEIAE